MVKILTMIDILNLSKSPYDIKKIVATNVAKRRKEMKLSQQALSEKSGVSLGSIKRFERTYEISFNSLIKLAIAMSYEDDILELFSRRYYKNIEDYANG